MSRHFPYELYEALLSPASVGLSVAPTVMALGMCAGVYLQASGIELLPELPAATTTGMFAATAFSTAVFMPPSLPRPPRLMLMMAGFLPFVITNSIPFMMPPRLPLPRSDNTFTPWRMDAVATPYVLPPTVPAQ